MSLPIYCALLCSFMTFVSYLYSLEGSFFQSYDLAIHSFRTPHFVLGIVHDEVTIDGYPVDQLRVGFIFLVFKVEIYKVDESVAEEFPHLKPFSFREWFSDLRSTLKKPIL